jgi:hypothetical protein
VVPFSLTSAEKRSLACVLGLSGLSVDIAATIADAISAYKATETGSPDTTVGNTLAALAELEKSGRAYRKAVARIADDRAGIDYTTHGILQPLAKAVLAKDPNAAEALLRAASARAGELRQHKRVNPSTEPLRFFCGVLRLIFNKAAAPALRGTTEEGWHHCRRFAMEVFDIAGVDHADFDAHPERLTQYLGTDVSVD